MKKVSNTDLLPSEISDCPWLYENKNNYKLNDSGKWMLFYPKELMDKSWNNAKKLYREKKLDGVECMKCSTLYENPRALNNSDGIIILYCNDSSKKEIIINIGKNIIDKLDYREQNIIYYKTDLQTIKGTNATGCKKNYNYRLINHLYMKGKCLINLSCSNTTLSVEEPLIIYRDHPIKKQEKPYPKRYNISIFEKFKEMNENNELQDDYKKWKAGINYNTNRKIKIGGKLHRELEQKFLIKDPCGFCWVCCPEKRSAYWDELLLDGYSLPPCTSSTSILFEKIKNINVTEYLEETKKINNKIDNDNIAINNYNNLVNSIIKKIEKLETWDQFVEFDGKKYGLIHKIKNNIHIENNCLGTMKLTDKETKWSINDRPFCNYDDGETTYLIYKCSKCNFIEKIVESSNIRSSYESKIGFWWK